MYIDYVIICTYRQGEEDMRYGYIRVSSKEQNLDRQLDILAPYDCDVTYQEKVSGKNINDREEFKKLLEVVVEGDEIYVTELSRFARSVRDLSTVVDQLDAKGVRLYSVKEGFDLSTSTGRMLCNIVGAIAQFERETIHERQAQGIAAAKARGKTWGREKQYGKDKVKMERLFANYYTQKYTLEEVLELAQMPMHTFHYQYRKWRKDNGLQEDLRYKRV